MFGGGGVKKKEHGGKSWLNLHRRRTRVRQRNININD